MVKQPDNKSALEKLREILELPPTVSNDQVLEEGRKFFAELPNNKLLDEQKRKQFLAAYKQTMLIIAQVEKTDTASELRHQNWMRNEQLEQRQALIFLLVMAREQASDAEEEEDRSYREFIEVDEHQAEGYTIIENPPLDTYPRNFADQHTMIQGIIDDLKLQGILDLEAIVVQQNGQKTIMLKGITPENSEKVKEAFKAYGYEFRDNKPSFNPRPSFSGKKLDEEEAVRVFNPKPKV